MDACTRMVGKTEVPCDGMVKRHTVQVHKEALDSNVFQSQARLWNSLALRV